MIKLNDDQNGSSEPIYGFLKSILMLPIQCEYGNKYKYRKSSENQS